MALKDLIILPKSMGSVESHLSSMPVTPSLDTLIPHHVFPVRSAADTCNSPRVGFIGAKSIAAVGYQDSGVWYDQSSKSAPAPARRGGRRSEVNSGPAPSAATGTAPATAEAAARRPAQLVRRVRLEPAQPDSFGPVGTVR